MRSVDFTTESPHVNVHEIGLGREVVIPNFLKEHFSRQHLAFASHHIFEQTEFAGPEIDRTLAASDGACQKIELQWTDAQDAFSAFAGWP